MTIFFSIITFLLCRGGHEKRPFFLILWSLCFSDRLNELRNDFKFSNIFFLFLMSIMVNIAILNASSKYDD